MQDCVVIIDPQKDFISPGGKYAKRHSGIKQILDAKTNINNLVDHIAELPVVIVYSSYQKNQFEENLSLCIPGTDGHRIDINYESSDILIEKKHESAFSSNDFMEFLKQRSICKMYLAGFLAEYCVYDTAIDALKSNIGLILIENCIGTADDRQNKKITAFDKLKQEGAAMISNDQLIANIRSC